MSDTDDTDNLLLIPPDLFTIPSDTEDIAGGPYYKVVESLITQVSNLENRINTISSASESSINQSLDYIDNRNQSSKLMSGVRKYSSLEDLPKESYRGSTQTTPQKPNHRINSLPTTPNIRHTPKSKTRLRYNDKKNQSETLDEIDAFISNVKTIQKFQSARNLSIPFSNLQVADQSEEDVPQRMNLNDVNHMLKNVESHQKDIESRFKENEIESQKNEPTFFKEVTWQEGDTVHSVPNRGMGMRNLLYNDRSPQRIYKPWKLSDNRDCDLLDAIDKTNVQTLTTTGIFGVQDSSDLSTRNTETFSETRSLSSSDSTQTTAYQVKNNQNKINSNAARILDTHHKLLQNKSDVRNEDKDDRLNSELQKNEYTNNQLLDFEPTCKNALVMMSLSDLWNQAGDTKQSDRAKFFNKLQEENLRRQHCEQLIQKLQTRTLELQERLAVAIQVDGAKDEAISQIHKSWEEAAAKIDSLYAKNNHLEQHISELQDKLSHKTTEAVQKITFYEKESSKALNLAHNSQERLQVLEKENIELSAQLQSLKTMLKDLQDSYNAEKDNVKQLSTMLSDKENELKENKFILADARKEISQSKKAVEICQTELNSMRATQNALERQLNEELDHIKEIEKEKKRVLIDVEAHKKIEKSLQDELNKQKEKMENHKLELRNFYQDQVEIVVREKLREFQLQLDKAENSLQEELHNRELTVAKAAALHIQQVTEKHALEIHLIEEKHKEEIKLYNLQLSKSRQQNDSLQAKLQQQQDRKTHIAQQLHKVMEAQWLEALKILNSKTPVSPQEKPGVTVDQLNSLKSRSYNNVEEILFREELKQRASGDYKNTSSPDTVPEDSQRNAEYQQTPLTSRPAKTRQQLDQEMQKYIQMLLNKPPGNPTEENLKKEKVRTLSPEAADKYQFQNNYDKSNCGDGLKSSKTVQKDHLGKPPWK
ncbi:hypothetical protein RN001_004339 [Aquatica leii]|uniref:Centrobin n=1 Tax=Aquatica leii TaxID=1421715 RepID=A0AAN7P580_9COLE|nr:hypothetical protein RN001_004339 [Aquatica leii]